MQDLECTYWDSHFGIDNIIVQTREVFLIWTIRL